MGGRLDIRISNCFRAAINGLSNPDGGGQALRSQRGCKNQQL